MAVSALGGATAIVLVRLAMPGWGWAAMPVAGAAVLAPLAIIPSVLRRRDPDWLIAAEVDNRARAGGLAMALAGQPAGRRDPLWLDRLAPSLATVTPPALHLPGLVPALAALAMLAGSLLLPQAEPPPVVPVIGAPLRATSGRLDQLRDERLAPPEAVQEFTERLAAIRAAVAERGLDQQSWAALDALDHDLEAERDRSADRLADALAKAEALSALSADGDGQAAATAAAELAAAAAELAAAAAELERQAPGLAAKLPAGAERDALARLAQQAAAGEALTPAQRAALERFGLDPSKPGGPPRPGDAAAAKALAERLAAELAAQAPGNDGDGDSQRGGNGGPGPGGGHADLTWGEGVRIPGGYRDRLAGGQSATPEAGPAIGTRPRQPRPDELTAGGTGTAVPVDQAPVAADKRDAQVAPRHRAAAARYFAAGTGIPPTPPSAPTNREQTP